MKNNMLNSTKTWRDKFDKTLGGLVAPLHFTNQEALEETKQFISQALDQVRLETIKEVEEVLPNELNDKKFDKWDAGFNTCLNQIKSSLNKLK